MKHFLRLSFSRLKPSVFLVGLVMFLLPLVSWGQIIISNTNPYSEVFDGMGSNGTTFPTGWSAVKYAGSSTTIPTNSNLPLSVTDGGANSGGVYNIGTLNDGERAFGSLASGTVIPRFGVGFRNNTGSTVSTIDLSGVMEQWRSGTLATTTERTIFEYSLNASGINDGGANWVALSSMDLVEKLLTTTTAAAVNGNLAANQTPISGSIINLSLANGSDIWIRWSDSDASGSDGLYAIDNFSITFQASSTPITAPTDQASLLIFSPTNNSVTASWTNGNGSRRIVLMNTTNSFVDPANGTDPAATTVFSNTGQQVVFNGTGNSVTVTGLNPIATYWLRVYEYNGTGTATMFNVNTATDNPLSFTTLAAPCVPISAYFQGFEPNNNWPIASTTAGAISTTTGSGDFPANQRILLGTHSWQTSGETNTLELNSVDVSNFTGKKIKIRLSSTSATSGNGADGTDYVKAFVALNGTTFPTDADITINGNTNIRYGYGATLVATTSAGVPATFTTAAGGNNNSAYATLEITIPDNATSVALKIDARNNDSNEFWNIDDIEVLGCEINPCNEPLTDATNFSATPTQTSAQLNWTIGSGTKRMVILSQNPITAAELPVDGNYYEADAAFGTAAAALGSGFVVLNGNAASVNVTDLVSARTYYYAIVEYSCAPENYKTVGFLTGSFNTLGCSEPVVAAINIQFSNVQQNSLDLSWTNGNGHNRIVVAVENNAVSASETPVDGITYTAGNPFGTTGTALGNGFVVYNGSENSVTVTGLTHSTNYHFAVFEYSCNPENYKTDVLVTASQSTAICPGPTTEATALTTSLVKDDKISLNWISGNGSGRIIIAKAGSPLTPADYPVNGTTYAFNASVGAGFVAYRGTGSSTTVTGLSGNTTYYFGVFEYTCAPGQYLTANFASADATTEPGALVTYSFNGAVGNEVTFPADAQPANGVADDMSRGTGLNPSNNANRFSANNFSENLTLDLNDYFSFKITPNADFRFSATKLELDLTRSSTGPKTWEIRSSLDNFADFIIVVDLSVLLSSSDIIIPLGTSFSNVTTPVEFRIYAYGATGTAGTGQVDNLQTFGAITQTPLPVELLSFTAKTTDKAVQLNWATASEKNADRFEIQRSSNAITFETIGSEKAQGNSQATHRYAFTDKNPLSGLTTYYRLKQIDLDGTFTYSAIVKVTIAKTAEITLFPNPTREKLNVRLPETGEATLRVFNVLGQEVLSRQVNQTALVEMEIKTLPAGTYQLRVTSGTNQSVHKFIKLDR